MRTYACQWLLSAQIPDLNNPCASIGQKSKRSRIGGQTDDPAIKPSSRACNFSSTFSGWTSLTTIKQKLITPHCRGCMSALVLALYTPDKAMNKPVLRLTLDKSRAAFLVPCHLRPQVQPEVSMSRSKLCLQASARRQGYTSPEDLLKTEVSKFSWEKVLKPMK